MMGMNIIPSIFLEKMRSMEVNKIVEMFDYFKDDLPNPDSFVAELLQWQVSSCNFLFIDISIDIV